MRIEDISTSQAGEVVYYAHGTESMRTYRGLSKMHSRPNCPALLRRSGSLVRDTLQALSPSLRCRICNAAAQSEHHPEEGEK